MSPLFARAKSQSVACHQQRGRNQPRLRIHPQIPLRTQSLRSTSTKSDSQGRRKANGANPLTPLPGILRMNGVAAGKFSQLISSGRTPQAR